MGGRRALERGVRPLLVSTSPAADSGAVWLSVIRAHFVILQEGTNTRVFARSRSVVNKVLRRRSIPGGLLIKPAAGARRQPPCDDRTAIDAAQCKGISVQD